MNLVLCYSMISRLCAIGFWAVNGAALDVGTWAARSVLVILDAFGNDFTLDEGESLNASGRGSSSFVCDEEKKEQCNRTQEDSSSLSSCLAEAL